MEELIQIAFFVIIIVASMMDGVRRQRQRRPKPPPRTEVPDFDEYPVDELPEYAARYEDPTSASVPGPLDSPLEIDIDWDDGLSTSGPLETPRGEARTEESPTAETMVPPDLWEEIRSMARGEVPPAPEPPVPASPLPPPSPPSAPRQGRVPDTSSWDAFEDAGADRSGSHRGRPRSREKAPRTSGVKAAIAATEAAARDAPDRVSARGRLEITRIDELRRALVLKEILGTPRGLAPPEGLPKDQDG